jgi:hypothetical protein
MNTQPSLANKKEKEETKEQEVKWRVNVIAAVNPVIHVQCAILKTNQWAIHKHQQSFTQSNGLTNESTTASRYSHPNIHQMITFLKHLGKQQDGLWRIFFLALRSQTLCRIRIYLTTSQA